MGSQLTTVSIIFLGVILTLTAVVAVHLIFIGLLRLGSTLQSGVMPALILAVAGGAGCLGLWVGMESLFGRGGATQGLPQFMKIAAIFLYLAGCIVYAELRSLLSRGYSLRILVDLLSRGGSATVESLIATYGDGLGVDGLLAKRLTTLASMRLVRSQEHLVGPLTPAGTVCAALSTWLRQVLRLGVVG